MRSCTQRRPSLRVECPLTSFHRVGASGCSAVVAIFNAILGAISMPLWVCLSAFMYSGFTPPRPFLRVSNVRLQVPSRWNFRTFCGVRVSWRVDVFRSVRCWYFLKWLHLWQVPFAPFACAYFDSRFRQTNRRVHTNAHRNTSLRACIHISTVVSTLRGTPF